MGLYDNSTGGWKMKTSVVLPLVVFVVSGGTTVASAQSLGAFIATGSLTSPRQFHTATLLTNGRVLIAGGFAILSGWPAWTSTEIYDPSTGSFMAAGQMSAARYLHTATLLPDGRVLIAGGNSSVADGCFCSPLASAELYDSSTGSFTAAGAMTTNRSAHTATLLNNGKVLIAGGSSDHYLASAELYDPSTGRFTATGPMTVARRGHTATLLADGKVLIAGGRAEDDPDDRAELYDPETGVFTVSGRGAFPGLVPATATLLSNGKVLVTLQYEEWTGDVAELYDPLLGTFNITGKMSKERMFGTSTLLSDGKVLVTGRDLTTFQGIADIYDPASGTFSTADGLVPSREEGYAATLLPSGGVLMSGGWICCGYSINTAVIYRPVAFGPAPVLISVGQDGRSQGAIVHAGTSRIVSADDPAETGEALEIYCSGLIDGSVIPPQVAIGGGWRRFCSLARLPVTQASTRSTSACRAGSDEVEWRP
jgi:hypothetical protein